MSAIAGIVNFSGQPVAPGEVEAMTAAMVRRGPDGLDHWRKGNVAMGQCMLRTTPESLEETLHASVSPADYHSARPGGARHLAAASSSLARASTQRAPSGVSSFFQNGARVLR